MSEAMHRFQEAKRLMSEQRTAAQEVCKLAFNEACAEVFAAHPLLRQFAWSQYTPYFNDGDECVFGANTDYPSIWFGKLAPYGDEGKDDDADSGDEFSDYTPRKKIERGDSLTPQESAGMAVIELLGQFDEDDYKECFGDHARVVVRRDSGIEVEEYSHD